MAARKDNSPSVATFADHEVITPAHPLYKAIAQAPADDDDPVARAEAALAQLSSEFAEWMQCRMRASRNGAAEVVRQGFTEKTHAELFRAAHDIKGEAATFGYPAVVGAADSLCRLLEHTPGMSRIPLTLVEQHVDAVRAIAREHARDDLASVAGTSDPPLARGHGRILAQRKRRPAGLSGKHLRADACAVARALGSA